jgi:hypothetical protein
VDANRAYVPQSMCIHMIGCLQRPCLHGQTLLVGPHMRCCTPLSNTVCMYLYKFATNWVGSSPLSESHVSLFRSNIGARGAKHVFAGLAQCPQLTGV